MNKSRLAIIGSGNIVSTRHLPALYHHKLFDVIGILDIHGKRSIELAKKYSIPHSDSYKKYKSLNSIRWFRNVDAVIVATPPFEHGVMVKQSLLAGKHVLVEKPFVTDIAEGKELLSLAKQ